MPPLFLEHQATISIPRRPPLPWQATYGRFSSGRAGRILEGAVRRTTCAACADRSRLRRQLTGGEKELVAVAIENKRKCGGNGRGSRNPELAVNDDALDAGPL